MVAWPMTPIHNILTEGIVRFRFVADLSNAAGAVAIVLLVGLLIYKEMTRARDEPRRRDIMRLLDVGILPLLTAAGVVITLRLWYIL
jgi:hypothetical protein